MMVHWGLYSLLGGEYRDTRALPGEAPADHLGEWIMNRKQIPIREYEKLAAAWNPVFFDADEWCEVAKSAGMRYIVITAKHHEGFALFHSKHDAYNVVDATPYGKDIIAELAAACKRHGLKLGLYYSQEIDWHERHAGGYTWEDGSPKQSNNHWDFSADEPKDFDSYFEKKALPQVRELLTNYGDIFLVWFDTPGVITREQSQRLFDLVKSLQPNCLVNTRIGNGLGDYRSMGDNQIADEFFGDALVETPATLNDTWGFKYFDDAWKSAEEILRIKRHLNARGVNYLLNVGPDALGRIPLPARKILREVGEKA
jgi:alpha-L-fucosidase